MADKFDPYREALVMEMDTVWPDSVKLSDKDRARFEQQLHAAPDQCANLEYMRTHTGFCRRIVVTDDDLARLGVA